MIHRHPKVDDIVGCCNSFCAHFQIIVLQVEVLEPAVKGTLNVLKACTEAKVRRVVVVSSTAAVSMDLRWPKGKVKDETCWSDKEYDRANKVTY